MKTYINFPSKKYYHVEENGSTIFVSTVVSVNLNKFKIVRPGFDSRMKNFLLNYTNNDAVYNPDNNCISFSVFGQATCKDGDTFDKTVGMNIAETNMQKQAFKVVSRFYAELLHVVRMCSDDYMLVELYQACAYAACNAKLHSDKIGGI